MPPVPPAAETAAKWARVTPGRQTDFDAGVKDPSVNWERGAATAVTAWEQGIQDAIQAGALAKGITAAGNAKWQRKTIEVGTQRWGPGVRAAQADMEAGFGPYRDVIERTQLPARSARGDPRNQERSAVMSRALAEARRRR